MKRLLCHTTYYNYSYIQEVDTPAPKLCSEIDLHTQSCLMSFCWFIYFILGQIYQKFLEFLERFGNEHDKLPVILELLFQHMENLEIDARDLLMTNGKIKRIF